MSKLPVDAKRQTLPRIGLRTDKRQSQPQPAPTADIGWKENQGVGFARLTREPSVDLKD